MRKRIAFISEHASPLAALGGVDGGGQNVYVDKLAKQLSALGYDIDIFTRRDNPRLAKVIEYYPGVRVIHVNAGPVAQIPKEQLLPFMDEFTNEMLRLIRYQRLRYEIIHANFFMSGLIACEIKKALGIPFVVTFHALGKVRRAHQGEQDGFPPVRVEIEERIIREADGIIAECPQDQRDLVALYSAPLSKISMIPCGSDPHEFYPMDKYEARATLGLDRDERIILQLGRMVPRKGVDTAIQAIAILRHVHKIQARLLIVGGESEYADPMQTPEIGRLMELTEKLKLEDNVTFVGRRDRNQLKYFYNASDIFVTTPWYEPFGITPLEAMACATPVVGSNVGGVKYSVVHEETGLLVAPKDPEGLAEAFRRCFSDAPLYAQLKRGGPTRVKHFFTWDAVARQVMQLYEHLTATSVAPDIYGTAVETVHRHFDDLQEIVSRSQKTLPTSIIEAARLTLATFRSGGKVLICGNGGSAADAEHFAAEFVGRFQMDSRRPLPAIALSGTSAATTAIANDFGYEQIFARQIDALGNEGDLLFAFSTSGNSKNLVAAFNAGRRKRIPCIGVLGRNGGELFSLSTIAIVVPSDDTQRIQEMHTNILHMICDLVERNIEAPALAAMPKQRMRNVSA